MQTSKKALTIGSLIHVAHPYTGKVLQAEVVSLSDRTLVKGSGRGHGPGFGSKIVDGSGFVFGYVDQILAVVA